MLPMISVVSFTSIEYLVFFLAVVLVFYLVSPRRRFLWLLFASYLFYASWSKKYALLLLAVTVISWFMGENLRRMRKTGVSVKRRLVLFAGILVLILSVWKYAGFFQRNVRRILLLAGREPSWNVRELLLPLGLSFYMFKAISYVADCGRGTETKKRNFWDYALYLAFFPEVVQGPIDRARSLIGQFEEKKRGRWLPDPDLVWSGLVQVLWGLFLKLVIADRIALLVNTVFDRFYVYGTVELAAGALGYALQIYCDFAGYSSIAAGCAAVLGIRLCRNFFVPYFALSVRDFWRRWHISLSEWFRDYVYIPLGGSRVFGLKRYRNILVTMMISGLWHGSGWSFVIWGGLHGLYQIAESILGVPLKRFQEKTAAKTGSFSYRLGCGILTFLAVDIAWIFFRAGSAGNALRYLYGMVTRFRPYAFYDGSLLLLGLDAAQWAILLAAVLVLILADQAQNRTGKRLDELLADECLWFRWAVLIFLCTSVWVFGMYGPGFAGSTFIYQLF